jgi:hypothetical protein
MGEDRCDEASSLVSNGPPAEPERTATFRIIQHRGGKARYRLIFARTCRGAELWTE